MARRKKTQRHWIVTALVAVAAIAALALLPLRDWAESLESWFEGRGATGALLFAALYVVATLLLLPTWLLTIVAGALFGLAAGFALAMAAAMTGSLAAFLLGRYAFRDRAKKHFSRNSLLKALDKALRRAGWKAVALTRLSPIVPFTVQNYFYGVSAVKLWHFAVGTGLGIVPGTLLEVFIGSRGRAVMSGGGPLQWAFLGVGIVATAAAAWYVGRVAKEKLGIRK
jgi:uncharacterized membrane protein YdjX (TVP38/TMEM64 family)